MPPSANGIWVKRPHIPEFIGKHAPWGRRNLSSVMLVDNTAEIKHRIEPGARLIGLDVGKKTVGLALSDGSLTIASPFDTIRRKTFAADVAQLRAVIESHGVGGLIIGLPINMNGTEGPRCQSVRQFQRNLEPSIDLPMAFWDERLSTAAVTRTLLEADTSRARRAQVIDKMAAAYILQGVLDFLQSA